MQKGKMSQTAWKMFTQFLRKDFSYNVKSNLIVFINDARPVSGEFLCKQP
jgi:hypothetical protein